MRHFIFLISILLICTGTFVSRAFAQDKQSDDTQQTLQAKPVYVKTMIVGEQTQQIKRRFFGRIVARETVDLSFEVGGKLNVLNAPEGASLEEGALIGKLDLTPFQRAVRRAEIDLAQAERDMARAETLAASRVGSEVRAQDARTRRDLAAVALQTANDALEDAQIQAPFKALVATRVAANFTLVEPGQPIVRLHDMSQIRAEFDLPERLLRQIGRLESVTFETCLADRSEPITLKLVEFNTEPEQIGQAYTITLAFPDIESDFLVPGATLTIDAKIERENQMITIPVSATSVKPDGTTVAYAINEKSDGTLILDELPIEVISTSGTNLSVTGLDAGTEIVSIGAHLLNDEQAARRYRGLTVEGN